jgi:hypothetical protein
MSMSEHEALMEYSQQLRAFIGPLIFNLLACGLIYGLASKRGYSGLLWAVISWLTYPMLTACVVAALPDRRVILRRQILEDALSNGEMSFLAAARQGPQNEWTIEPSEADSINREKSK